MVSNRIQIVLRIGVLVATQVLLAWLIANTRWYATISLTTLIVCAEVWLLIRQIETNDRHLADFLTSLESNDVTRKFSVDGFFRSSELTGAMNRVITQLREARADRETQARYSLALLSHMPVALILREADGDIQLINPAARRLFAAPVTTLKDCLRYGAFFAEGLERLRPGESALLTMERPQGQWHLKAVATEIAARGHRQTVISLQNIASELNAQELAAWQTVIRTMTHEVMNSLTPISSLSATAEEIVRGVRDNTAATDAAFEPLNDAVDALEAVSRRSSGLMRFVQDHRRLTHRLVVQPERLSLTRIFARLHRLLAAELESRGIAFHCRVEPETLELTADPDLIDQALINLLRNAMDALRERPGACIRLTASRYGNGRVGICVADNGPGIPADTRETVFVPFYTTKKKGTGVGLTLVRQIAAVHGAEVSVSETDGGGATLSLVF